MNIDAVRKNKWLIFESIYGSKAYGTQVEGSDTDYKGVFISPKEVFFGLKNIPQVSDDTNDQVFYELGRFVELLLVNNPNMLELLSMPTDCIRIQHPLFLQFTPELFLSKLCGQTFGNYAMTQIRKAKGLNKKILNPMSKEVKGVLDFCYILEGQGSKSAKSWLSANDIPQEHCGLVKIDHVNDLYALFYTPNNPYEYTGIVKKQTSNDVSLSSVPKEVHPINYLSFNKNGYQTYCKTYKEYWSWVEKRNDERYKNTIGHGKNYDSKNMMHTFRLLGMAGEIAKEGRLNVRRPDRTFLLKIRNGEFEYDDLLQKAEQLHQKNLEWFHSSDLPAKPDEDRIMELLVKTRKAWYETVYKE